MDRFTQPENIAVKDWTCQKCGKISQEANKRLSIKRLPPVLSIQFKVSSCSAQYEENLTLMTSPTAAI